MNDKYYWRIDYKIKFLSDFHIGCGVTLIGGNLMGLQLDEDDLPYLPGTQVRGLIRLGGWFLKDWQQSQFEKLFNSNFRSKEQEKSTWSYTRAHLPVNKGSLYRTLIKQGYNPFDHQSHIKVNSNGIAENLFSFQKSGEIQDQCFIGSLFSVEPRTGIDVAFMLACMRAEDRIGHRRTRGYGKVNWKPEKIYKLQEGKNCDVSQDFNWLDILFKEEDKQ
jgi:CRISPR/Cas system CSM-associated protein Csm3 (group 7 of RAMP superfamily)